MPNFRLWVSRSALIVRPVDTRMTHSGALATWVSTTVWRAVLLLALYGWARLRPTGLALFWVRVRVMSMLTVTLPLVRTTTAELPRWVRRTVCRTRLLLSQKIFGQVTKSPKSATFLLMSLLTVPSELLLMLLTTRRKLQLTK